MIWCGKVYFGLGITYLRAGKIWRVHMANMVACLLDHRHETAWLGVEDPMLGKIWQLNIV